MSIEWSDRDFGPIESLDDWTPPSYGGIYAISYIGSANYDTGRHTILYIGQTGNFSDRPVSPGHDKYDCCKRQSNQAKLYVRIHRDDDGFSRILKESELVNRYKPVCNST